VVLGLALRNEGKFPAAKAALEKARAGLQGDNNPWLIRATEALAEVSDPAGWYARRAQALHDRGQSDQALALLNWALEALPGPEQAALLARRSLIELDVARASARGAVAPTDPMLETARKDAAEAAKAGLPEGLYAAGRVAEATGQYATAADYYRKALAAHPAADADGSRYRIALARMLVQPREAGPAAAPVPAPMPAAEGDKVGRKPAATTGLLAVLLVGLQAPPPAGDTQDEAERLADEVLRLPPNAVPFDVRAQALAVKGRWTPALMTYVEGLRALLPPAYAAGLADLVRNHPGLRRAESLAGPNPVEAEKHYAAGLNFYFDRDYAAAEKELLAAVDNDSQDARYYYYLALARLALNRRRQALEDLDQGATLEAMNKPAPAVVSAALERVQGPVRRLVNDVRTRPR
jgi:tetratricopeptide (TPR) repeat protein